MITNTQLKDDVTMLLQIEQKYQGQTDTSKMAPSDIQTLAWVIQQLSTLLPESGYGSAAQKLFNDLDSQTFDRIDGDPTLLDGSKATSTDELASMISIENGNGLFNILINDTTKLNNLIPNH